MKSLIQFLVESTQDKGKITLSRFVDILADAKYRHDDMNHRCDFICMKADIADDVTPDDHKKLQTAIQTFYDADRKYRSNMDSFLSAGPKSLSALFGFTSFEDDAVKKYEPVKKARNAAYDVLCELINKYTGEKVSESVLEAKHVSNSMQDAIEIALTWKQKANEGEDKELMDQCIFWTIVFALDENGNAWAKEMYSRSRDAHKLKSTKEKFLKEITDTDAFKMIRTEISKIFDQHQNLLKILELVDDGDELSASDQKHFDSELNKLETMKNNFIAKCKAIK